MVVPHILIDADTLLYRIGFLYLGDGPEKYIAAIRQLVSSTIRDCIEAFEMHHGTSWTKYNVDLIFSGKGEKIRNSFDKESIYKEQRAKAKKPVYIAEMLEEIISNYEFSGGFVTLSALSTRASWGEADDFVSCMAWNNIESSFPYMIAGCDKDLLQIPGLHYNYLKKTTKEISPEEANRNFFIQLLMGDVADSVPGLKGIGHKRATYILGGLNTPEDMYEAVENAYINHYNNDFTTDEIAEMIYERANKLWLRRKDDEIWTPPIPS